MIQLLFFGSDYNVGLTQALSEQILLLKQCSAIDLYCVSSEKEMESGLHDKLSDNKVLMEIVPALDVHKNFRKLAVQLEKIIDKYNITHINVHNNWQLALVSYVKYKKIIPGKLKIIYTIHGYRHNSWLKAVFAIGIIGMALLLLADRVISMSSYVSKRFWFIRYKTDIIFYGMTHPEFQKTENKFVINQASPIYMVFPGQFRKGKNQDILIKALRFYIDKTHDMSARLYLPGDGVLLEKMQMLAKELQLTDNIVFPGKLQLSEIIKLYETTNIALVSSNVETYGRCIAEPFLLGRCVITKKTGIATDIITDKVNGCFFTDEKELAEILVDLYNHPYKIVEIGNNAFNDKYVFSNQAILNNYLKVLKKA